MRLNIVSSLLAQLKQRQVFKVGTIYAVSAWPLIQIADLAVPALGLPDSVMTMLLQIFLIGFPIVLVFAWLFNFTSAGIVRVQKTGTGDAEFETDAGQANVKTTIAVVGTLVIALLAVLTSQFLLTEKKLPLANNANVIPAPPPPLFTNNVIAKQKESIAILPFIAFSQDPADEFFADGMVEELLNLLAKIPGLQVSARTSSFAYKGVSNKTIVEIGEELGVDTILEGSIRKNDVTNQIRVTAQLIKVSTGEHLWSETFNREYRDIFQIQDDIAKAVVAKMKVTLLGDTSQQSIEDFVSETTSVNAMIAHSKGKDELEHRTVPSLTKALAHFEQAVREDNKYARAYVGIADANILLALYGNHPKKLAKENAQTALDQALKINPNLGAAYATLGLLFSWDKREEAEQHFKKAISLNDNYAMTFMWYGSLLQERGDEIQAHKLFERALKLNPKSPVAAYNVASGYYKQGNEKKAMELFSQIIANDPYYPSAYNLVGDILSNRGRLDEALNMYQRAVDIDGINKNAIRGLLVASMDMGDFAATDKWFDYIAQQEQLFTAQNVLLLRTRFYATKNNLPQALSTLEQVVSVGDEHGMSQYFSAEVAFFKGEYAQASTLFESVKDKVSKNKNAFYNLADGQAVIHLAYAYQQLEKLESTQQLLSGYLSYLQQTLNQQVSNPDYYFNLALVKALQKKDDEVFYYLQAAIDAGWVKTWQAEMEPAIASYKGQAQFMQMLGGVKAKLATMRQRVNNEESFLLADTESFEEFH
jgi:TolB-like protein/Tfp pilus assembly protein PilF